MVAHSRVVYIYKYIYIYIYIYIYNEYFIYIAEALGIHEKKDILMLIGEVQDLIEVASKKYSSHPSIELICKNKNH